MLKQCNRGESVGFAGDVAGFGLRAAVGDLYSIPGLGPKGHSMADTINAAVDEALKEYIQR